MTKSPADMPSWAFYFLRFAAIYNVAWGLMMALTPKLPFQWSGLEVPNYPAFLQCLGVVIGVLGVGYWIAASDPASHWLMILVGLLAKVVWPTVFLCATGTGDSPPNMLGTIFLNDILWWLPLGIVLIQALRVREARRVSTMGITLEQALREAVPTIDAKSGSKSLLDLSFDKPLLLACVRHLGCTFCREALGDLANQRQTVEQAGLVPVVISMASANETAQLLARYGLSDVPFVSDPDRRLFGALELPFGTLNQLVGWNTIRRAVGEGVVFQYGFGMFAGNGLQLSGTFIIKNGCIVNAIRHATTADRTDLASLTCSITSATAS